MEAALFGVDYAAELAEEAGETASAADRLPRDVQAIILELAEQGHGGVVPPPRSRLSEVARVYRDLSEKWKEKRAVQLDSKPSKFTLDDARLFISARFKLLSSLPLRISREIMRLYIERHTEDPSAPGVLVFILAPMRDEGVTWIPASAASFDPLLDMITFVHPVVVESKIPFIASWTRASMKPLDFFATLNEPIEAAREDFQTVPQLLLYGPSKFIAVSAEKGSFGYSMLFGVGSQFHRTDLVVLAKCIKNRAKVRVGKPGPPFTAFVPETGVETRGLLVISAPLYRRLYDSRTGAVVIYPWEFRVIAPVSVIENQSDELRLMQPYDAFFLDDNISNSDLRRLTMLQDASLPERAKARLEDPIRLL